ncbi:MAG: HD domain-containing protein [Spirochaetaceae bacterium]|nr:HD domain-containing protein [Spirochaetaceae bacterium]
MNKVLVAELKPDLVFEEPVYLDGRYIILSPDTPTTDELLQELHRWNYTVVFTPGNTKPIERSAGHVSMGGTNLDQNQKEREGLAKAQAFYDDFLKFTHKTLDSFGRTNSLNLDRITEYIKKAIEIVKENQYYILRFTELKNPQKFDYSITHAVRSTILALTIAQNVKTERIPPHKVIELGISALLHEVGMLQIPPALYNKKGNLTPEEKKTITAHPILGFRLLKEMKDIRPLSQDILMGVLQHHERENGTGYPQHLTGDKISSYGKIISIACSYDAQISNRPHREGKDGHSSMTTLLKEMQSLYDTGYVTALMASLTLFPLGSYVVLGDGTIATVVRASEQNVRLPYVKLLLDEKKNPVSDCPVVPTNQEGLQSIVRVLNHREVEELKDKSLLD